MKASCPERDPAIQPGAKVVLVLRILLTLLALYFLWLCVKFAVLSNRITMDSVYREHPESIYQRTHSEKPTMEEQRARFPLPLFPGMQNPEFGEMELNGHPFFRVDFDVSARPERILHYYRQQLVSCGWHDITEEAIRKAAMTENPYQEGVLDLQNEAFLRNYDHMMRTQATFTKWGAHATVAVKDGGHPWLTRVGIHYIEYGSPQQLAQELEQSLGIGEQGIDPDHPTTFSQNMGAQRAETTLLTSADPPEVFCQSLVSESLADGWRELDLPQRGNARDDGRSAFLMADNKLLFIQVSFDPEKQVSRAVMTRMMARGE